MFFRLSSLVGLFICFKALVGHWGRIQENFSLPGYMKNKRKPYFMDTASLFTLAIYESANGNLLTRYQT